MRNSDQREINQKKGTLLSSLGNTFLMLLVALIWTMKIKSSPLPALWFSIIIGINMLTYHHFSIRMTQMKKKEGRT